MLDVSNAKISGAALAYVIHESPSSTCLKVGAVEIYFQKTGVLKMMDPTSSLFLNNAKYCHDSSFILSKFCKPKSDWYIIDALGERLSVLIKSFLTATCKPYLEDTESVFSLAHSVNFSDMDTGRC
ncbi:hypothetical protein RJT34_12099 [Clitoria ternatea]|uniref:Uncharacterized protein n=1 Tax=Clitoria ternatea TaxID=43366 RepID=A0AAN9JLJ9_CLITE